MATAAKTEMGSMILVTTAFYILTNVVYYPYFVGVCYNVGSFRILGYNIGNICVRLFCLVGFAGGLKEHIDEMHGWLRGKKVRFGNPFNHFYSDKDSLIWQWTMWIFVMINAAFAPFGIMVCEYVLARPNLSWDSPTAELVLVVMAYLATCLFGVISTARGELIGCTRQWHFEHVLVHAGFAFLALCLGGVYDRWNTTTLRCHLLFLGALTLFIEMVIILMDTKAKNHQIRKVK